MEWNYRRNFRRWKNIQETDSRADDTDLYVFFLGEENSSNDVERNTGGYDMTV